MGRTQDAVALSVLPLFHVTGMLGGMNSPLYVGATTCCCRAGTATPPPPASQRYRITTWQAITTMVIDFLANPRLASYDLSSLPTSAAAARRCPRRWPRS